MVLLLYRLVNEATPLLEGEHSKKSIVHLKTIDEQLTKMLMVLRGLDKEVLHFLK